MVNPRRRTASNRGMEDNTMAILDVLGANDSPHLNNDRIAFLEAIRFASIFPEDGTPPTNKMWEAIFQILKEGKSLELIMSSYQLLCELEKRFPRVYLCNIVKSNSSPINPTELVVIEEAWSPFDLSLDAASSAEVANRNSNRPLDSSGFHILLEGLAKVAGDAELQLKLFRDMLLFQFLVIVIERDFLPRNSAFLETTEWTLLRESLLNVLLGSRRINYKAFIKDCLSILSRSCATYAVHSHETRNAESNSVNMHENGSVALALALPEVHCCTRRAAQNLLVLMMELDSSRKKADMQGLTTRADGVRTPALAIVLDEFTYNKDMLCPFFQVFDEPKLKLDIILKYFGKYIAKPSVRTRRSNGISTTDDITITGVLKSISNSISARNITKRMSAEVVQLLIAHAFQACILLPHQSLLDATAESNEDVRSNPLLEICNNIISSFSSLREVDKNMEILPLGQEALFTAATILSAMS
ncbi:hypothetical protein Nepgr_007328 [Nepenthes gracilis]|uniref:Negative regulator of systemic acquired resistance SNI1 n=1 Tax=Nepenthes gracilis TaxID=150966 RepID=A0AAD3XI69_NEPGR|nr:hypothetical protein Nepgr_007328 [Nepenthes gracilis]